MPQLTTLGTAAAGAVLLERGGLLVSSRVQAGAQGVLVTMVPPSGRWWECRERHPSPHHRHMVGGRLVKGSPALS